MPQSIETLLARPRRQLIALAQVRNTLPRADQSAVIELYDACSTGFGSLSLGNLQDWQLELIDRLARAYLCEVV